MKKAAGAPPRAFPASIRHLSFFPALPEGGVVSLIAIADANGLARRGEYLPQNSVKGGTVAIFQRTTASRILSTFKTPNDLRLFIRMQLRGHFKSAEINGARVSIYAA